MGQKCACFRDQTSEEGQLNILKELKSTTDKNLFASADNHSQFTEHQSLVIDSTTVIKLQSVLRGFMDRALMKENRFMSSSFHQASGFNPHPRSSLNKIQGDVPSYANASTIAASRKLGAFTYETDKNDGILISKKDPILLENGAVYIGEWNENLERHGKGVQFWIDGSKYEGHWRLDRANGKGRLIHGDGDVYEGDWSDDKAHGYGIYTHADGGKYAGIWQNDKQHGHGIEEWPDGSKYEGEYVLGKKNGKGKFNWADGSSYEGDFDNNNIQGYGAYSWSDGRHFLGDWHNNKMHGKGCFTWDDGRCYKGDYVDDKKQGYGVFTWPDGRKYEGFWLNGKQHGRGMYSLLNGERREGEWKEGVRLKSDNLRN